MLSIAVAKLDGVIVRDLVSVGVYQSGHCLTNRFQVKGDGKGFLRGLGLWFLLAIPSTYTNSMASNVITLVELSY